MKIATRSIYVTGVRDSVPERERIALLVDLLTRAGLTPVDLRPTAKGGTFVELLDCDQAVRALDVLRAAKIDRGPPLRAAPARSVWEER